MRFRSHPRTDATLAKLVPRLSTSANLAAGLEAVGFVRNRLDTILNLSQENTSLVDLRIPRKSIGQLATRVTKH